MEELLAITKVLGEENEKRFKAEVTDLLINQVKDDLSSMCNYLIDWEELFDEIREELKEEFKTRLREKYMRIAEDRLSKLFDEDVRRNET